MERSLLRLLTVDCAASLPFVIKRKNLLMHLTIFFSKGVLSTCIDSYCIKSKKLEYPVRPYPKIFDTNVLYDLLFFPLLSVIWVRLTYDSNLKTTLQRSLWFSVPMSIAQLIMEKKTDLFKWKSWSVWHTFASINITLFTIRGMVWVIGLFTPQEKPVKKKMIRQKEKEEAPEINTPYEVMHSNVVELNSSYL